MPENGDHNIFDGSTPIPQALEQLRLRLLDLTGRNRLLNFRHTAGKSLPLVPNSLNETFKRLTGGQSGKIAIEPVPDPQRTEWVNRNGRATKPEVKEYASGLGLNVEMEELPRRKGRPDAMLALQYGEELGKHWRKLDREARLAIEETGANMMYLVLGFLEFPDTQDSSRIFSAPLICVPVRMETAQERQGVAFKLSFTGEDVEENLSLCEKLKRDYTVNLPPFPDEEDGIESYLAAIEGEIARKPGWRVRRATSLALLSFANMLLVRDLDPERWATDDGKSLLLEHPIIQRVFEGGHEPTDDAYGKEFDLDEMPEAELPLIFDADSSQHSAIVEVMAGKSLVIEGPPGTGKSQTITNIIAACLHAGKSVLFVAEKLAALQVVKSRLEMVGLDPFLLELHSNKTSKRQVLDSLAHRMGFTESAPRNLSLKQAQLSDKKAKLREHAALLNSQIGNKLGCTVHQILWRADRSRRSLGTAADCLSGITIQDASTVNAIELHRRRDGVSHLAKQFVEVQAFDDSHPLWGFFPESLLPGDDLKTGQIFSGLLEEVSTLCELDQSVRARFGFALDGAIGAKGVVSTLAAIDSLKALAVPGAALDVLPNIFGPDQARSNQLLKVVSDAAAALDRIAELEQALIDKVDPVAAQDAEFQELDLADLRDQGLAEITVQQLLPTISELDRVTRGAAESIQQLDNLAADIGLSPPGTPTTYERLLAVCAVAAAAPLQDLHLRNSGLGGKDACEIISRGIADRIRLNAEQQVLGDRLYLDQAPSDAELREWILTLRQGWKWYRVFQKPWRTAVRAHRRLTRDKKPKVDWSTRLEDFEKLSAHRRSREAWLNSVPLKAAIDCSLLDFEAPLERLLTVAKWLRAAQEELSGLDVSRVVFDPLHASEDLVARMSARRSLVDEHSVALKELNRVIGEAKISGPGWEKGSPWNEKLGLSQAMTARLRSVHQGLAGAFAPHLSVTEAHSLLGSWKELSRLNHDLVSSDALALALGPYHASLREDFGNVAAAMKFGRQVARSPLPQVTKQALWSEEAQKVLDSLHSTISSVQAHWKVLTSELEALSLIGRVDPEAWLLEDLGSDPGCERTRARLSRANDDLDSLLPWSQYVYVRRVCVEEGFEPFVRVLEERLVPPGKLEEAFCFRFHASIAESLIRRRPALRHFSAPVHNAVRQEFAQLDREIASLRGKQVSVKQLRSANPPTGQGGARVGDKTEMCLLEYLVPQQRPRVTVREMLRRAGESIRTLKPCFMMGPQAVAQFLHATPEVFDVVVMDEASQLRPEEAIGAIARGCQLVVVGDPKQLPPTSFFSRSQSADDSQPQMAAVDAESILDVASSHFRPIRTLRWHYRSRHESLIAFSNVKFYRGNLVVFPSPYPRKRGLGVRSHYIAGAVYDNQMNQREAARIVDFALDHILHHPDQSLGVVALNVPQRDLITELLDERLKSVAGAQEYRDLWADKGQGLFVKNLENVQGDERDAIIISTTFGPPPGGTKPRQNFGPISQQGGWRRLNVLFTRAKSSVLLVTSLKDTDIVVGPETPAGTRALRDYLTYAATGQLHVDPGQPTSAAPESPFEESVIEALREHGFSCVPQVGVAGFRIDIGVRHPLHPHLFLAGIECDGASYHSGITVRDRDRIRQEILEGLGWRGKLWRIWSTEWFRNPRPELRKLIAFLESLKQQEVDPDIIAMTGASSASSADEVPEQAALALESVNTTAEGLVAEFGSHDAAIGDHVTYRDLTSDAPTGDVAVLITRNRSDPAAGIISQSTPLAQVLLGALVGDRVEMRVSGQRTRVLEIRGIKKPT